MSPNDPKSLYTILSSLGFGFRDLNTGNGVGVVGDIDRV